VVDTESLMVFVGGFLLFLLILKQVRKVWLPIRMRELHRRPVDRSKVRWGKVVIFFLAGIVLIIECLVIIISNGSSEARFSMLFFLLTGFLLILWGLGIYYIAEGGDFY